jgi:subtilisin family serine protease
MIKDVRRTRWGWGVRIFGILSILAALSFRTEAPVTSAVPRLSEPTSAIVAPTLSAKPHDQIVRAAPAGVRQDYIVQASSVELARSAVRRVGGVIKANLEIIRAVGASLDSRELAALSDEPVAGLRIYDDATVTKSGSEALPETYYPTESGASSLHQGGVTGRGVTVAVLDTGLWHEKGPLQKASDGRDPRVLAQYDVILARENPGAYQLPPTETYSRDIDDRNGHGTHVSSIIASSGVATTGRYQGVAPGVNLVSVRVLDNEGAGRYSDVIQGIQWVVSNRTRYSIRVMNLSLSGLPQSHYWEDPLNQAVMSAWKTGIVVVAAAGNRGADAMTIGVPGNVPYVITVGAITDNYHPNQVSEYRLASFSSAGPTFEGFIKPEVVAMGGHIRAYAPNDGTLAQKFPQWVDNRYPDITMSGTSQAAAVTSGVVALMLEANPSLTPDNVKCRLMSSADPAVRPDGRLAYTVFQQGAGMVNAQKAVYGTASGCANRGLDVALDLAGRKHFGGRANQDADGNFYVMEVRRNCGLLGLGCAIGDLLGILLPGVASLLDGLLWDGSPPSGDSITWSGSYTWADGYTWSDGYTFGTSYTWADGYTWADTQASGIELVEQE